MYKKKSMEDKDHVTGQRHDDRFFSPLKEISTRQKKIATGSPGFFEMLLTVVCDKVTRIIV